MLEEEEKSSRYHLEIVAARWDRSVLFPVSECMKQLV